LTWRIPLRAQYDKQVPHLSSRFRHFKFLTAATTVRLSNSLLGTQQYRYTLVERRYEIGYSSPLAAFSRQPLTTMSYQIQYKRVLLEWCGVWCGQFRVLVPVLQYWLLGAAVVSVAFLPVTFRFVSVSLICLFFQIGSLPFFFCVCVAERFWGRRQELMQHFIDEQRREERETPAATSSQQQRRTKYFLYIVALLFRIPHGQWWKKPWS
jgi:hypothetical protein